ncbi:MAG: hypothetical protein IT379_16115 [Deltaproteobacteria bacterium]|nr:hypothetical protein [Deltaproteobacteria bacterium]
MEAPPPAVADLADACVRFVKNALHIELDRTPETLPLLDHYLAEARASGSDIHALLAPAAGAYFGEVVRAAFPARWTSTDGEHAEWRLEIEGPGIVFNPVGMALEAIASDDVPGAHAHIDVAPAHRAAADAALAASLPVEHEDYYRLTTRFEVLELLVDRLVARAAGDDLDDDDSSGERAIVE